MLVLRESGVNYCFILDDNINNFYCLGCVLSLGFIDADGVNLICMAHPKILDKLSKPGLGYPWQEEKQRQQREQLLAGAEILQKR
jgi:hypothetical protein